MAQLLSHGWIFPFQQQIKMGVKTYIVVIVVLSMLLSCKSQNSDCFGEQCAFNVKGSSDTPLQISEIISLVDSQVRRIYWFYLRKAQLLYQTNIDTPEKFLNFFIYRNHYGTFMCITSWEKNKQEADILNFVRLGNGYSEDVETPYSPVDIEPRIISLRLAAGEFLIEIDQNGNFTVNGKIIDANDKKVSAPTLEEIDAKAKKIDQYLRENYEHYLRGAKLVHKESISTTVRLYTVLTYINIVGTFLVIGSCDNEEKVFVNTFVRLGAGAEDVQELQPIKLQASVVTLQA